MSPLSSDISAGLNETGLASQQRPELGEVVWLLFFSYFNAKCWGPGHLNTALGAQRGSIIHTVERHPSPSSSSDKNSLLRHPGQMVPRKGKAYHLHDNCGMVFVHP